MMKTATGVGDRTLTEGPILRSLIALSGPIVLANALHAAYQLANTFWVGRLGANAVAAVSLTFPVFFLLISLGGGIVVASSTYVAQYAGARNARMVSHVAAQTMWMIAAASLLLTTGGYVMAPRILQVMGIAPEVMSDATAYMRVTFLGITFMFVFAVFQSVMRSIGEVRLPLRVVAGTVLLNVIVDPILIFGWFGMPAFGVRGAAYGTFMAQGIASGIGLWVMSQPRYGIALDWRKIKPDFAFMKRAFMLGLPASLEQSVRALGLIVMTFLVTSFGTIAIAAYGIGSRVMSFAFIPAMGLSLGTAALVGQNIGAGNVERAAESARASAWAGFFILGAAGLFVFAFSSDVVRFFVPHEPELIQEGGHFVRLIALTFGLMGIQQSLIGALRGAGSMMSTMVISMVALWVLQFPLGYVLSKHTALGLDGIWWAYPISHLIATAITVLWFMTGRWKSIRLTEEDRQVEAVSKEIIAEEGVP